jgi:hypothetical protein
MAFSSRNFVVCTVATTRMSLEKTSSKTASYVRQFLCLPRVVELHSCIEESDVASCSHVPICSLQQSSST